VKDTVIFQGVTQFTMQDGTAVRAINQGGGQFEIQIRHGEFFVPAGVVCLVGQATPARIWAAYRALSAFGAGW